MPQCDHVRPVVFVGHEEQLVVILNSWAVILFCTMYSLASLSDLICPQLLELFPHEVQHHDDVHQQGKLKTWLLLYCTVL